MEEWSLQPLPKGFGSYLFGIIPEDQAIAAGAFSMAIQQIKNISQANGQQFSQVVQNLETNTQLPATSGSNVPVDLDSVNESLEKTALGGGVHGTYTHSDFFGAMTGLPYPLLDVYELIKEVETAALTDIYQNIFNLANWGTAEATVTFDYYSGNNNHVITGFVVTNSGGGYNAPPSVTVNGGSGASGTAVIGTDPNDIATYKKVISITLTNSGTPTSTVPTVTLSAPPNDGLGTSWTSRNSSITANIAAAALELTSIKNSNPAAVENLSTNWNILGTALKVEQRARYIGIPPVAVPRDKFTAPYPTSLYSFVDSLATYASDTLPHGAAQCLEAMTDRCTAGGQNMVALMREQRNEQRLTKVGIPLDNTIPDTLPAPTQQQLFDTGGAVPNAVEGIPTSQVAFVNNDIAAIDCCGDTSVASTVDPNSKYTIPAKFVTFDCSGSAITTEKMSNNILTITAPILDISVTVIQPPPNIIPPELTVMNTSNTLSPAILNSTQAIATVTECNCNCWNS